MDVSSLSAVNARVQQIMEMAGAAPMSAPAPAQAPAATGFARTLAAAQSAAAPTAPSAVTSATGATGTIRSAEIASSVDPQLAARLDAWMAQRVPNSPLIGHGADFVQAGVQNGVDPRFLVAVAAQESGLGTAGSGANINNPFGWGPAKPFASWTESIQTVAAGLAKGYLGEGRDTIAAIQAKWAPVGAANDPGGLNSNWTAGVSKLYAEMGGSPAGTVRI